MASPAPFMPFAGLSEAVLNALPNPVIVVDGQGNISAANSAAEEFFQASASTLRRRRLQEFVPFGSPLLMLIDQARERNSSVSEHRVDLSTPRTGAGRMVDVFVAPVAEMPGSLAVMLQERSMADKIDRQLTHRGAARSITALGAMLAHEIKNPLSGIRGAAQLLEQNASDPDRELTRLICDEADRIVALVDRMEVFSDQQPIERGPVNIHEVL